MGSRPVLMAMAGATCIAFSAILVRLADVPPSTAAFYRCAYALPPLALLAWWERRRFGPLTRRALWLSLVAGIFFMADLVLWHHAIAAVGAGLATVLGNVQVVIVPLAAWALLGEKPAGRTLGAVPIVLFGVVLISGVIGAGAYGLEPGPRRPLRRADRDHVRRLFARPQGGKHRPAPPRRPPFLRDALGRDRDVAGRGGPRRAGAPAHLARAWLARPARPHVPGGGLAPDRRGASAPPGGPDVGDAHAPAGALGRLRGDPPRRGAVGRPARRRGGHHRGRRPRDGGSPQGAVH